MKFQWVVALDSFGIEKPEQAAEQVKAKYALLNPDLRPTVIMVNCQNGGEALYHALERLGAPVLAIDFPLNYTPHEFTQGNSEKPEGTQ